MLIQYVRNNNNEKVGTVIATGKDEISFSLISPEDRFNKAKGKQIAVERLMDHKSAIPYGIYDFEYWGRLIYDKCREEYKGHNLNPNWGFLLVNLLEISNRARVYFK